MNLMLRESDWMEEKGVRPPSHWEKKKEWALEGRQATVWE